ncbi:S16 family serine protease [Actinomadura chokoriensis]|uniref:S16 family serine protease n=1 Tax=Actinomadura chokoriensis TaxID=454156 RepID=UPI0031F8B1C4
MERRRFRYRLLVSLLVSALMLAAFGATDSPYLRVDGGPLVQVGRPVHGSWTVTAVRIRRATWSQWARAEMAGEWTYRADRADRADRAVAADAAATGAMARSQTYAVLVAAQLAAGRAPVGGAGLQVTEDTAASRAAGLRVGDVLLAAGQQDVMTPLRTSADLRRAAAPGSVVRVLITPKTLGNEWGTAVVRRMTADQLVDVPVGPGVSAHAYSVGGVQGPSAGLLLTLARVDDLTSGDLTGGRRVAGTGAIALDGGVTSVGWIIEKVRSAAAAGVEVFFVPAPQAADAARAARGTPLRVVPVGSVSEAIGWLCGNGGHAPIC